MACSVSQDLFGDVVKEEVEYKHFSFIIMLTQRVIPLRPCCGVYELL